MTDRSLMRPYPPDSRCYLPICPTSKEGEETTSTPVLVDFKTVNFDPCPRELGPHYREAAFGAGMRGLPLQACKSSYREGLAAHMRLEAALLQTLSGIEWAAFLESKGHAAYLEGVARGELEIIPPREPIANAPTPAYVLSGDNQRHADRRGSDRRGPLDGRGGCPLSALLRARDDDHRRDPDRHGAAPMTDRTSNPVHPPRLTVAIVDYDLHNHGRVREVVTFADERTARVWLAGYWHSRPSRVSVWLCGLEPVRLKGQYPVIDSLNEGAEALRGTRAWSDYNAPRGEGRG